MDPATRAQLDAETIAHHLGSEGKKKLHLGCGENLLPGWLNSDLVPQFPQAIRLDAASRFPLEDACLDYVFSEHMIEHITYAKGQAMLAECFRVLKPGGKIRISTPDMAFVVGLYQREKTQLQKDYIHWAAQTWIRDVPCCEEVFVINGAGEMKAMGTITDR